MQASFWQERWEKNQIAFHLPQPNPLLRRHFAALTLLQSARILVPLCGKSVDIAWLLSQGRRVVGVELIEKAVNELFTELTLTPQRTVLGPVIRYSVPDLDVLVGDIFAITPEMIGPVDAVYDRAALVALPENTRPQYAPQIHSVSDGAKQLLITYEYDQALMPGPPFSISDDEVQELYSANYSIALLESVDVSGGLKGQAPAREKVWLLQRR